MMLDTPTSAHPLPTPPGSPTSLATATSSPSGATTGQLCRGVRAEMAQQANEVCQLVAKANQAPNGLQAEELRRLLSDIHTLQVLAQQLHPTAGSTSSAPSSPSSSPSPSPSPPHSPPGLSSLASWGAPRSKISKKKPAHHTAALSRPLSTSSPSPAAACGRSCMPPIRPRLPPSAPGAGSTSTTTTTTSTTPSSASPSETLMPTSSTSATITIANGVRACANCGTTNTVQWRCGADGKPSLCNACGLRYRYNLKKKALYEDIACVRALSLQRSANASPPYPHLPLSPTGSLPRASPALTAPAATMAATMPTRQPRPMAITSPSASMPTAATGSMAIAEPPVRRSNIYSLLN